MLVHCRGITSPSHVEPIDWQSTHIAPPEPQLLLAKPALHVVPFAQHPVQFEPLQGGGAQTPPLQISLIAAQFVHAPPPLPHCLSFVGLMHVSPAQHPLQFIGPHFGGLFWHVPPLQNWFMPAQF